MASKDVALERAIKATTRTARKIAAKIIESNVFSEILILAYI
jgi:hypothetical protein